MRWLESFALVEGDIDQAALAWREPATRRAFVAEIPGEWVERCEEMEGTRA